MNKKFLEINNLSKHFENNGSKITVLNNINLKIETGNVVAIIGPSGSGKSTFLHLISLLDIPSKGKIKILGKSVTDLADNEKNKLIREHISIIFQNNNLLSDFTAVENVALPLIIRDKDYRTSIKLAEKFLKKVNLGHRLNHFPSDLSGGEQQRVAIARSLIAETDLILADEPTGNLDFKTSKEIFDYFLKLKKMKKTILFATHNRELANKADYKLSISNGNIKRTNG